MLVERRRSSHWARWWRTHRLPRPSLGDAPGGGSVPAPGEVTLPASGEPAVSAVVPVHGRERETLRCLGSIARARVSRLVEVVVVDDGSPPGSPRRGRLGRRHPVGARG
ncbi:MAG: glycosyltransferase [Thermoanaerobaculia bacterium]